MRVVVNFLPKVQMLMRLEHLTRGRICQDSINQYYQIDRKCHSYAQSCTKIESQPQRRYIQSFQTAETTDYQQKHQDEVTHMIIPVHNIPVDQLAEKRSGPGFRILARHLCSHTNIHSKLQQYEVRIEVRQKQLEQQYQGNQRQLQRLLKQMAALASVQLLEQFVEVSALGFLQQAGFGSETQSGQGLNRLVRFVDNCHINRSIAFFICIVDICPCSVEFLQHLREIVVGCPVNKGLLLGVDPARPISDVGPLYRPHIHLSIVLSPLFPQQIDVFSPAIHPRYVQRCVPHVGRSVENRIPLLQS